MIELPVARPRLDRKTARSLDRLARRAHAFHRFAHHPLCGAYAGEVIRIGKRGRLCRGCAATGLGLLCGAVLGIVGAQSVGAGAAHAPARIAVAAVLLGLSTSAALLTFARSRSRHGKWLSRGIPALGFGAATTFGVAHASGGSRWLFAVACAAFALGLVVAYRRRGPNRAACATCPERFDAPCSGFLPIVRRERAFQRRASALLDARFTRTRSA